MALRRFISRGGPEGGPGDKETPSSSAAGAKEGFASGADDSKPLLNSSTANNDENADRPNENSNIDDAQPKGPGRDRVGDKEISGDIELGSTAKQQHNLVKQIEASGPLRVLEPLRTDPVKALYARQRRLDRLTALSVPEIHFVGQIKSGLGLIDDITEGACCRWKIDYGKAWEHLGGDTFGQTQISYPSASHSEHVPFNHPLDVHFAEAGLQGWGAPRLSVQCYKMDWHGRRILIGYGFTHLPTAPGMHTIEVCLWRPSGSPEQEMDAMLLGRTPALVSHEPIYESAWKDRCRLVTVAAGKVFLELFVVTRNSKKQGVDM